jgi:SAM-dependent methyltransferase
LLSRLPPEQGRLLDAGSVLNFSCVLAHPKLQAKDVSIVTLAPEEQCHWRRGVSYVFADIRNLPFRDNWFDQVVSLSTLEHVGKDNTRLYTGDGRFHENDESAFLEAVRELRRVCNPGGKVYISVPYGRFTDFGWYQQFDARRVQRLIEAFAPAQYEGTYYRYESAGWTVSSKDDCKDCEGFDFHKTRYADPHSTKGYDADFAAASRAVVCLELSKGDGA